LITLEDPLTLGLSRQIADLATKARLPAIYGNRNFAEAGGLMSYGVDRRQLEPPGSRLRGKNTEGRKASGPSGRTAHEIRTVINLKTAKALGLTIPSNLLALADELIE
jgi:putative tryptophan/tyrosine transport system substrate-binding protein